MGILPLIADVIPWNEITLWKDDFLGRKALLAVGLMETLMLISMLTSGYAVQRFVLGNPGAQMSSAVLNQDVAFLSMVIVKGVMLSGLTFTMLTINKLMTELSNAGVGDTMTYEDITLKNWSQWIARSLKPLTSSSQSLQTRVEIQTEQIAALSQQLGYEKQRTGQYNLLLEMSYQLEAQLDPPVAAQIAVNTLQRALNCSQVAIYEHDLEEKEFAVIASAGNFLPPGYRQQTSEGVLGRALRLRKTQIVSDTKLDHDYISLDTYPAQSLCVVPLIHHGHVKAMLEIGDEKLNAFNSYEVHLAEKVASELLRAWERSSYRQRLTNLIRAGISLSPLLEPQTTIKEIATIARDTLQARFIFVMLLDQEGNFSRVAHSGDAPRLLNSLAQRLAEDSTIKAALNAYESFRIRDIRKYSRSSRIEIDHAGLRSLLAIPIRLHRLSIGAILAFGKQGEVFFSENDESLAGLLSSQAATAIEATWLYQELRNTLNSTTQLYNLSVTIIQAEQLNDAARHIAETAAKVANATASGIVLFSMEQEIETEVEIDENGAHPGENHPMELIQQTLQSGQTIHVTPDQVAATICFPLQTPLRKYGALWLEIPNIREYFARHASNMQTLANQAALALERSILLVESQQQARAIEAAFQELELAYDRTLVALMSALDARDRETEGHSTRVSELACRLGKELRLDEEQLKALERGSLLHDIGKIGISDTILHKPAKLTEDEWKLMRLHPDIGARIVEGIPFLEDTLPVIRYHQERWDGSGYPAGLSGNDIPELARIFAIVDAFDALTSDRPYRERVSTQEALAYLKEQAGILFDPNILPEFEALILEKRLEDLGI
ncbi:MAG: HD domain-containing phosphohydrolase [Chloroflexota bacterium]